MRAVFDVLCHFSDNAQGGASFGQKGAGAPIHTILECQESVDVFAAHGFSEYDTSNVYANGTSEEVGTYYSRS